MEKNLLTTLLIVPIAYLVAYFVFSKINKNVKTILNIYLGVQTVLSGALLYLLFKNQSSVEWFLNWGTNTTYGLNVSLKAEQLSATLYFYIFLATMMFYIFINNKIIRSNILTILLLNISSILMVFSQNLFSLLLGLSLSIIASMQAMGTGSSSLDKKASAFSSWVSLRALSFGILITAFAALSMNASQVSFEEINSAKDSIQEWVKIILTLGLLAISFCYPILSAFRTAAYIGKQTTLCFNYTTTLFVSIASYKLYPLISSVAHPEVLTIVISISALIAAFTLMSETNGYTVSLLVSIYTTFLILIGSLYSSNNVSLTYMPVILFSSTLIGTLVQYGEKAKFWSLLLLLTTTHLPIFSGGIGLLEVIKAFFEKTQSTSEMSLYLNKFSFCILVVSHLLYITGVIGFIKHQWNNKGEKDDLISLQKVVVVLAFIFSTAIFSGLPSLSGFPSKADIQWAVQLQWLSQLISIAPEFADAHQKAVITIVSTTIIAIFLALLGMYSNEQKAQNTRGSVDRVLKKLRLPAGGELSFDLMVWDKLLKPALALISMGFNIINNLIVTKFFDLINAAYNFFQNKFGKIENELIDKKIIGGIGGLFVSTSKAFRFLQTGQIQFYFAFGVIVLLAILYRLIFFIT